MHLRARMSVCVAVVAALAAASSSLIPVASAAPRTSGFTFYTSALQTENCVEQQSGGLTNCGSSTAVLNPTPCIWTVDQYTLDRAAGDLAANGTATDRMCLIADGLKGWWGEPHWISASVSSSRKNLAVTLSDQFGNNWAMQPAASSTGYTWSLCMGGPSYASYPTVPNSNGGFGVETDYTLTVRNTTGQVARSVTGQFEIQGTTGPC